MSFCWKTCICNRNVNLHKSVLLSTDPADSFCLISVYISISIVLIHFVYSKKVSLTTCCPSVWGHFISELPHKHRLPRKFSRLCASRKNFQRLEVFDAFAWAKWDGKNVRFSEDTASMYDIFTLFTYIFTLKNPRFMWVIYTSPMDPMEKHVQSMSPFFKHYINDFNSPPSFWTSIYQKFPNYSLRRKHCIWEADWNRWEAAVVRSEGFFLGFPRNPSLSKHRKQKTQSCWTWNLTRVFFSPNIGSACCFCCVAPIFY